MFRVSTAFAFQASASDFMRAQARQVEAGEQMSSGKRATDLKGFGRQSETLIAAKSVQARASGFVEMHKLLTGRLDAQNLALERVADAAEESRQLVLSAVSSGRAESLLANLNSMFGQAADALNWKHEGRYLFAGSQVSVEPVAIDTLAGLTAAPATADAFNNDQTRTQSRLNETTSLTTGFLASDVGTELFDVLKSIQAYHEGPAGPLTGELTPAQSTFLESRLSALGTAFDNLLGRAAENGLNQQRVDDASDAQSRRVTGLTGFIADVSEIDFAEAVARRQAAELAVQASAAALKSLKESSLLNFLPV
jgi:flagellar hook-associated protein 3 FlgL